MKINTLSRHVQNALWRGLLLFPFFAAVVLPAGCSLAPDRQGNRFSAAEIHLKKGDGYFFKSLFDQAVIEYSRAIALEPDRPEGYHRRGRAVFSQGRANEAIRDFTAAVDRDPGFSDAYFARGVVYFQGGSYSVAIDDFDKAIAIDPWNSTALYYKALACEKIGLLREAVEAYRGYIHCTVPREDLSIESIKSRIDQLEGEISP